jgi:choline dehydrogenase-like flavoprotein
VFVDGRDLPGDVPIEADVCVIGGGAAGIALALGLLDSSRSVLLVEGGGLAASDVERRPPRVIPGRDARPSLGPDRSRFWYLGGNTNTWAGNCRPLDEPDLEERDWVPGSWPIGRDEMLTWYERAQAALGLGDFSWYDLGRARPHLTRPLLEIDSSVAVTRVMQVCPVLSLAALHRKRLEDEGDLRVLLRTEAIRLVTDGGGDRVSAVEVSCADGRRRRIEADTVVLAAGGIDNARLLLASNDVALNGLGNEHDLVGRYFMDHWWFDLPLGDWGKDLDVGLYAFDSHRDQSIDGQPVWAQLSLSGELMQRERIPGVTIWFVRRPLASASVVAAQMLALSALGRVAADPLTDVRLFFTDAHRMPGHVLRRRTRRASSDRAPYALTLMVQLEQTPDRENRVRLSARKDALGRPEPELDLRLTAADRAGHERALGLVARELGLDVDRALKQMRLKLAGRRYDFFWHHTGTTRMADDPQLGVVDTDCRVHGISNLFVAGNSVFPTEGTAPPTLTIVALALRLAEHLKRF